MDKDMDTGHGHDIGTNMVHSYVRVFIPLFSGHGYGFSFPDSFLLFKRDVDALIRYDHQN